MEAGPFGEAAADAQLAGQVIGSGEKWITELPDSELRELFALSDVA